MNALTMRVGALAAIAVVILSACTADQGEGPKQTSVRDELRIALASLGTESFDPIVSPANNSYNFLLFTPLVGVDHGGTKLSKETGIAKDWKSSDDSKTHTFVLREGVKFHNGDEVTAEDVKYTLERHRGPITPTVALGGPIARALDLVTVKSQYEVEVRLKTATPLFPFWMSTFSNTSSFVVPKNYIEQVGQQAFNQKPIGSGPYKFGERQTGAFVKLEQAFPEHFAIGKPRFKRITYNLVGEESTRLAMLRSGEADFVDIGVDAAGPLRKDGHRVWQHGAPDSLQIWFQLQREGEATRDINVRKALSYAINREEIRANLLAGLAGVASTPFPGQLGIEQSPAYEYDLEKAKNFLAMTEFRPGGKKLSLRLQATPRPGWPQMLTIAGVLQTYWAKLGIDTVITYRDYGAFRAEWGAGKLAAPSVQLLNMPGRSEYTAAVGNIFGCKGPLTSVCDPGLDRIHAMWTAAANQQDFERNGAAAERLVREQYYAIGIVDMGVLYAGSEQIPQAYSPGSAGITFNEMALVWNSTR